ncbi:MAG: NapC/NirT family cytochrome c [Hydrogenophilaceae bacterium]
MLEKLRRTVLLLPRALSGRMHGKALPAFMLSGALLGAVGGIGFDTAIGRTSETEFCLSCHEMKTLQTELAQTVHFSNRSGVRVSCGDCHVPRNQPDKLIAKIMALDDLYAHVMGSVDTKAKFEARRMAMAEKVWAAMRDDNSKACRACHSFEAMNFDKQGDRPRRKHNQAIDSGETCIDCHKGIAHALPAGFLADDR